MAENNTHACMKETADCYLFFGDCAVKSSHVLKETLILSYNDVQPSNTTRKTSSLGLQQQRANFDRRFDEKIGHRRRRRGWRRVCCG